MEGWHDFFVAELGAAAALAGLLFVGLSVNQQRILQFAGLPERAVQGLSSLFLVFALASIALTPGRSPRTFGEIGLILAVLHIVVLTWLQTRGWSLAAGDVRKRTIGSLLIGPPLGRWRSVLRS